MLNKAALATRKNRQNDLPELPLHKRYFFHDVQISCSTNHPAIFALLDELLGVFSQPAQARGEVCYDIACYEDASQFAAQISPSRRHTETIRLITGTKLRYYVSNDYSTEYQSFAGLSSMNGAVLSVVCPGEQYALTQLEAIEKYQPIFLRRCVFLMALGQLMRHFQFEPCHAAAITAPWDSQQGALIFGSSGSGKTTLSLGCTLAGCGLLGDDLVMLREDVPGGTISAYALLPEVSVRSGTLDLWNSLAFLHAVPADFRGKRLCSIEQIRPGAFRRQAPIRLLVFPTLVAEGESSITRLGKAQTLSALVDQCMRMERTYPQSQEHLFLLLGQLAEQAPGYRMSLAHGTQDGSQLLSSLFTGGSHV